MEKIIHQNEPYQDIVRRITETDRQNPTFASVEQAVDQLYRDMGATVVGGISYSGEQPSAALFIHAAQSEAMAAFSNRPA